MFPNAFRKNPPLFAVGAILVVAAATIAGAYVFQFLGYPPCDLCLKERIPYYAGIAVAAVALCLMALGQRFLRAALVLLGLIFLASAVFGAYHAGVEWGFWPGPADCTGAFKKSESMADFLQQLQTIKVVRCDAAALRILGLSLAGWNAIISAGLVICATIGLRMRPLDGKAQRR